MGPGVIRSLRLRGCVLGQPGGLALAQTLRTSSSLRDVDFQSNFVGPRAGVALSARRFHSLRSVLTEIYLCHTCSCHEILKMETPGQVCAAPRPTLPH